MIGMLAKRSEKREAEGTSEPQTWICKEKCDNHVTYRKINHLQDQLLVLEIDRRHLHPKWKKTHHVDTVLGQGDHYAIAVDVTTMGSC